MKNSPTSDYVPGVCNINHSEVAYRKKAAYFGVIVTIILFGALYLLDVQAYSRIILFLPIFIAVIGYLQTKNKFCVAYGASGKQNAREGSKTAEEVADTDARRKDKQRANTMNIQAALLSLMLTIILAVV